MKRTTRPLLAIVTMLVSTTPADGQQEVTAVPISTPPLIDGMLDEAFWARIEPITGFRQRDPVDGAVATERTEVRVAYTPTALYLGMSMFDSEPGEILGNILQRGGWIDKDAVMLDKTT